MLTFRFISALPSLGRRLLPRRKAYDWSTWLDGRWHVLKRGEHYRKASAFRDAAKEHAAERGLESPEVQRCLASNLAPATPAASD
jgi:hypothetical protein